MQDAKSDFQLRSLAQLPLTQWKGWSLYFSWKSFCLWATWVLTSQFCYCKGWIHWKSSSSGTQWLHSAIELNCTWQKYPCLFLDIYTRISAGIRCCTDTQKGICINGNLLGKHSTSMGAETETANQKTLLMDATIPSASVKGVLVWSCELRI